jgi:hypothetical protein
MRSMLLETKMAMQLMVNKANGKWVEEEEWGEAQAFDSAMLHARTDMSVYRQLTAMLFEQGKVGG